MIATTTGGLAAWGAVYAAYPGLKIVHRPGRIHSNVDPLSRLPRIPPHNSPVVDSYESIVPDVLSEARAQSAEDKTSSSPAKRAAFTIWWWEDLIEKSALATHSSKLALDLKNSRDLKAAANP